jgi:hypothetical protein
MSTPLNIKWWGAKGTYLYPSDTTDDYPAFQAALNYVDRIWGIVDYPQGVEILIPTGTYLVSQTLVINRPITLSGEGKTSSILLFKSATNAPIDGIIFQRNSNMISPPAAYNSAYARARRISIVGDGNYNPFGAGAPFPFWAEFDPLTSLTTGHAYVAGCGIQILTHGVMVEDCSVSGFMLDAVHVEAIAGSDNANSWAVKDISVSSCGRHGLFVAGDNGNAGYASGLDINACTGWAVYDRSFLGNHYEGSQTAECGKFASDTTVVFVDTFATISGRSDYPLSRLWVGCKQGGAYSIDKKDANCTFFSDGSTWRILYSKDINNGSVNELAVGGNDFPIAGIIPLYTGNYLITVYWRVTGAPTDVNITVHYTDATGPQVATIANFPAQAVGSYSAMQVVNVAAGDEFIVRGQMSTFGNVFVSVGCKFMS